MNLGRDFVIPAQRVQVKPNGVRISAPDLASQELLEILHQVTDPVLVSAALVVDVRVAHEYIVLEARHGGRRSSGAVGTYHWQIRRSLAEALRSCSRYQVR